MENETVITNRKWDSDDIRELTVGERVGASRNYNGRWSIPGLTGDHFCGKVEEFESGQPWPYTGPDIEYGTDHIPFCCPRDIIAEPTAGATVEPTEPTGYTRAPTAGAAVDYIPGPPPPVTVTAGTSVDPGIGTPAPIAGTSVDPGIGAIGPRAGTSVDTSHPVPNYQDVTGGAGVDIIQAHTTCETADEFEAGDEITTVLIFVNEQHWYFTTLVPGAFYWFDFNRFVSLGSVNVWQGGCAALLSLIEGYDFGDSGHHFFVAPPDGRVWVEVTSFGSPVYEWIIYPA